MKKITFRSLLKLVEATLFCAYAEQVLQSVFFFFFQKKEPTDGVFATIFNFELMVKTCSQNKTNKRKTGIKSSFLQR